MGVIKGDFLGFTFNGIHSSELGIFRTSDGNRYNENLLPNIQDKTAVRPGADGTFFYDSFYTQRPFKLSIAFDNLSEEQFRRLRVVFSDKKPHELIFDEAPYKVYMVKITGTPSLKYVCFDKKGKNSINIESQEELYNIGPRKITERIYKGEGSLNFVAYQPFARSRYKYLDQYTLENVPEWKPMTNNSAQDVYYNLYEWANTSRLKAEGTQKSYNGITYQIDIVTDSGVMYYNAGDIETSFSLSFIFEEGQKVTSCIIGDKSVPKMILQNFELYTGDNGIRINSNLHLIEGIDKDGKSTGTLYNRFITHGDFFKLEVTEDLTWLPIEWDGPSFEGKIDYKYLYY